MLKKPRISIEPSPDRVVDFAGPSQPRIGGSTAVVRSFAAQTRLLVAGGARRVEDLRIGDRVLTADRGLQPLRWVGQAMTDGRGMAAPVCISAGALGNAAELIVAPEHRVLLSGLQARERFGSNEVLVPARQLVDGDRIFVTPQAEVTYHQILFDRHELVFAEGALCESLLPPDALDQVRPMALGAGAALRAVI